MHIQAKLKLQLAVVIAKACQSDAEIDTFLHRFTPSPQVTIEPTKTVETIPSCQPESTSVDQPGDVEPSDRNRSSDLIQQVKTPDSENQVHCLKRICEVQRQEIIKLRHELAENQILSSSSTDPCLLQKRPAGSVFSDSQVSKKKMNKNQMEENKKKQKKQKTKTGAIFVQNKRVVGHHEESGNVSEEEEDLKFWTRFDTLNRIIRLNQIIQLQDTSSPSVFSSYVKCDLLTLEAIKEAALGLLTSLQLSLRQVSKKVLELKPLSSSTIPRIIHLINHSLTTCLTPLFLPNHLSSISSSIKKNQNHDIWEHFILPTIYQKIESLMEEIVCMIVQSSEELDKQMIGEGGSVEQEGAIESIIELRGGLEALTSKIFDETKGWKGGKTVQVKVISNCLEKLCKTLPYVSSSDSNLEQQQQQIHFCESSASLIQLLQSLLARSSSNQSLVFSSCKNPASSIIHLDPFKPLINNLFRINLSMTPLPSSILHRKFSRLLMSLASL